MSHDEYECPSSLTLSRFLAPEPPIRQPAGLDEGGGHRRQQRSGDGGGGDDGSNGSVDDGVRSECECGRHTTTYILLL